MNGVTKSAAPSAKTNFRSGPAFEHALGDHVHQVVQVVERHKAHVLLVGAGVTRRRRRKGDTGPALDVHRHRKVRLDRGLPQRPELRFAVDLAGLQRDADLDHAGVVAPFLDLLQRAGDVVGVDPDGAAESVSELVGLQPARHQHLVARGMQRAAEVPVGHDAPSHRVQDRHIDATFRKQFVSNNFRARPGIFAVRTDGVRRVLAAGCAVPVHLVVRKTAALERLAKELPQVFVGRKEDMHAGVDDRRACPVSMLYHESHPPAAAASVGPHRAR